MPGYNNDPNKKPGNAPPGYRWVGVEKSMGGKEGETGFSWELEKLPPNKNSTIANKKPPQKIGGSRKLRKFKRKHTRAVKYRKR